MAGSTFNERKRRLASYMGMGRSQAIPDDVDTELSVFVNDAILYVGRKIPWDFLRQEEIITLVKYDNAGTISGDAAGVVLTGVGTDFDTSLDTTYLRIQIGINLHDVASVDSSTQLTLSTATPLFEDLSGETFTLYQDGFALTELTGIETANVGSSDSQTLQYVDPDTFQAMISNLPQFGHPEYFTIGAMIDEQPVLRFYPLPGYGEYLRVIGSKEITALSADDDTDDLPGQFSSVIDLFARAYMYEYAGDKRYQVAWGRAQEELLRMFHEILAARGPISLTLDPDVFTNPRIRGNVTYQYRNW